MKNDKILTKNPKGKKGVNISKEKYEIIHKAIIDSLKSEKLTHDLFIHCVKRKFKNKFKGSIRWYIETVKIDFEARKIIKRISETKPELYKITKK